MLFTSPVLIDAPPAPLRVRRLVLDAVEALRIAAEFIGRMRVEDAEFAPDIADPRADEALCRVSVAMLQEVVGDCRPTVSDRAFATLRAYRSRWPESHPLTEATALAAELAERSLSRAIGAAEKIAELSNLVDVLWAVFYMIDPISQFAGPVLGVPGRSGKVLDAILTGGKLPRMLTEDDVEAVWAFHREEPGAEYPEVDAS